MNTQKNYYTLVVYFLDDEIKAFPVEKEEFHLEDENYKNKEVAYYFFIKKVVTTKRNGDIACVEVFHSNSMYEKKKSPFVEIKLNYKRKFLENKKTHEFWEKEYFIKN